MGALSSFACAYTWINKVSGRLVELRQRKGKLEKPAYFPSLFIWIYVKLNLLSQDFPKNHLPNIF